MRCFWILVIHFVQFNFYMISNPPFISTHSPPPVFRNLLPMIKPRIKKALRKFWSQKSEHGGAFTRRLKMRKSSHQEWSGQPLFLRITMYNKIGSKIYRPTTRELELLSPEKSLGPIVLFSLNSISPVISFPLKKSVPYYYFFYEKSQPVILYCCQITILWYTSHRCFTDDAYFSQKKFFSHKKCYPHSFLFLKSFCSSLFLQERYLPHNFLSVKFLAPLPPHPTAPGVCR